MKQLYTILFSSLILISAHGQIAVTNATFPKVGDVLRYLVAEEVPEGINPGTPGENKTWDFSVLSGGTPQIESYLDKSTGSKQAEFPGANLLIRFGDDPTEFYANALTNRIEVVGFAGPNPLFGGDLSIQYNKRPQIRRSPMYYETTSRSEGEWNVQISSSVIPDTLLSQLPIRPDSIRITFASVSNDTLDAWGKLRIGGKEYDVLREKSSVISETKVFIKIPFLGWIDLGMFLGGGGLPGGIDGFLGADTTITYNFYTNTIKEILVTVDTDLEGNIFGVSYANTGSVNTNDNAVVKNIRIYPNPASDLILVDFDESITEDVILSVIDFSGKICAEQKLNTGKSKTEIPVSALSAGIYVIKALDSRGQLLLNQKVILQ